jgi:hypothetical protein
MGGRQSAIVVDPCNGIRNERDTNVRERDQCYRDKGAVETQRDEYKGQRDTYYNVINDPLNQSPPDIKTIFVPKNSLPQRSSIAPFTTMKDSIITEPFEDQRMYYTGGLLAKSNVYETLYKNYLDGYNRSVNVIQNQLEPEIKRLNTSELSGIQYAFTSVKNENELIQQQIDENANEYSTDNKQIVYQTDNLIYLKSVNFVIFIFYYCVYLIFLYFMIFVKTSDIKIKVVLLLFFFIYPFIIKPLEEFLYFIIMFFVSSIFGNVYVPTE